MLALCVHVPRCSYLVDRATPIAQKRVLQVGLDCLCAEARKGEGDAERMEGGLERALAQTKERRGRHHQARGDHLGGRVDSSQPAGGEGEHG